MPTSVFRDLFASLDDGSEVYRYTLANDLLSIAILDQGLRVQSLAIRLAGGETRETVLGFDSLDAYQGSTRYMGVVVGRYANRIRQGKVNIAGKTFELDRNEGVNHLHGGFNGFHTQSWEVQPGLDELAFYYTSPNGEGGYPGTMTVCVRVSLDGFRLRFDYEATCDQPTVVNLTNHAFFNLLGRNDSILDHRLQVKADYYLPVDEALIPTGELAPVAGTPFDFTTPKTIGQHIVDMAPQLAPTAGYDLCYALRAGNPAAVLASPDDSLRMYVHTSEPGLQIYTANKLARPHTGICLETQHYPDSPNHPAFPSTLLTPGETFTSWTSFEFEPNTSVSTAIKREHP